MSNSNQEKWVDLTLIVPVYNEEALVFSNLSILYNYLKTLDAKPLFEILVINDGSSDRTGELAEEFSADKEEIKVIHHVVNLNLGNALQTGFSNSEGEFIITYDLDLSSLKIASDITGTTFKNIAGSFIAGIHNPIVENISHRRDSKIAYIGVLTKT